MEVNGYTIKPGADLRGADLRRADLRRADLCYADLSSANLSGANLRGAYCRNVIGYLDLGFDNRGYHFRAVLHDDGWRINAGCRWFTVAEALSHWSAKRNLDALARVDIVRAAIESS